MRFRLAKWIMDHRGAVAIMFVLVTLAFSIGIPQVQIRTIFKDLLPTDDPFVQVHLDHPNFGNPLLISVMVKRKQGDIYNPETLNKVWKLTRDLDLAPKANHDTLISISTEKLRYAEATSDGVELQPLMDNQPPSTPAQVAEFRSRVAMSPNARLFYISPD
jgi:predicted RND superfamily exporter protein